jgi:hypothetical protein
MPLSVYHNAFEYATDNERVSISRQIFVTLHTNGCIFMGSFLGKPACPEKRLIFQMSFTRVAGLPWEMPHKFEVIWEDSQYLILEFLTFTVPKIGLTASYNLQTLLAGKN